MRRSRQRGTVDYLFLLLLLAFFFLSAPANGLIPVNYQIEFVSRHNYWRGQVDPSASTPLVHASIERRLISLTTAGNMEALYWSDTLGTYAQAWSDMCTFAHSGSAYGEKYELTLATVRLCSNKAQRLLSWRGLATAFYGWHPHENRR